MTKTSIISRGLGTGAAIAALATALPAQAEEAPTVLAEAAAEAALTGAEITVYGRHEGYDVNNASSPTKTDTPLIDVPQTVAVLNRTQLDDQAVASLNEALLYVPGVVLGQGEGHRDQVTLRGQNSTADFFLDGLRDDAQYYRPLFNTDRVEVLKGANAMIFGRGGGGGVINRVSKTADTQDTFGSLAGSLGSWGDWTVAADANLPLSAQAAVRINATYEDFDNHRDRFDGHFTGVAPTVGFDLGEATHVVVAYEYGADRRLTDRGIPSIRPVASEPGRPISGHYRTFFGTEAMNRGSVDSHIARARIDHTISDGLSANLTAQYAHYDKYYGNLVPRSATATTVTLEGYNSTTVRENAIVQGNLVWRGETGPVSHTLLTGVEAAWQDTAATRHEALFGSGRTLHSGALPLARQLAVPAVVFGPLSRSSISDVKVLSAYIQDQLAFGENLQLVAGLRYDDFRIRSRNVINGFAASRSDSKWSPRVGIIVKPQANISLYASYAISFLPQSGDQFAVLDATTATLAPEKFRNLEAGVKWDLTPELGLTTAVYQLDRTNTRSTNPLNGQPVLTGKSRAKGVEIALNGRITPQLQASLGYARQDGTIRATTTAAPAGRRLAQLPKHQLTAWARYDFTRQFGLGLGMVHQSAQYATISNAVRLPGFTRIDAAAYFDVNERLALQINAENLTDKRYFPSAHTDNNIATGEPFNVKATVRVKF